MLARMALRTGRRRGGARRARRIALFTLIGACAIALLVVVAFAVRLAVGPISLMAFAPDIEEKLSERLYYAYKIEFDDVTFAWRGGVTSAEIRFEGVRVRDYSSEVIATIPAVATRGDLFAVLKGEGGIKSITVERPKVRWIESPGGAIRFDIGADQPGLSGKILEDFLITLASAPDPSASSRPLPEIEAVDSEILIANELTNSSYRIRNAHVVAHPDRNGVKATYEFDLDLADKTVHLDAESLYRTDNQRIGLTLHFSDIAPNDLRGAVPMPAWLASIQTPLSGIAELDMDRLFHIGRVDLEASGGGSGGIAVSAVVNDEGVIGKGTMFLPRRAAADLAEHWPKGIDGNGPNWLRGLGEGSEGLRLKAEGTVKPDAIALAGMVEPDGNAIRVTGALDRPTLFIDRADDQ